MTPQTPTLLDVKTIPIKGPWATKSNGELNVLFSLEKSLLDTFLSYQDNELEVTKSDIRGLRMYKVSNLAAASIGAKEWHKIRHEIVTVPQGKVLWRLRDTLGNTAEYVLDPQSHSLLIPPYIMHTYEALEDNSEITVVASTLFIPEDPTTHDTYPESDYPTITKG